ncbi:MAG: OPT/YSL family transporter [Myxococcales bacterium]|nr:OPT/YSL family transporter [Myxococcales bacterium]
MTATVAPASAATAELTMRGLAAGLGIGAVLAAANVYIGLKTGFFDTGSVTAALAGAMVLRLASGGCSTALETNVCQTAATSAGVSAAVAGLLGAFPALSLMGRDYPDWAVASWGLTLAVIGVAIAHALRARLVVKEALPFPSGIATATLIRALHERAAERQARTRALLAGGGLSAAVAWLRDGRPSWIPAALPFPGQAAGVPLAPLGVGFAVSPMLLSVGILAGPRVGLSLLFGAVVAWGAVGPALVARGAAAGSYEALIGWLVFPGVGLGLAEALVSLAGLLLTARRALGDLASGPGATGRPLAIAFLGASAALVLLGHFAFDLHPLALVAAIAATVILSATCARAAGETDISPVGQIGQVTLLSFGAASPGAPHAATLAGAVPSGAAAQTGMLLWSFKAGHLLGASPRRQVVAQLIGALVGGVLVVPIYRLLTTSHGLGSPALPAPGAMPWKVLAELVGREGAAVPPGALWAGGVGLAAGLLLSLLSRTRLSRALPSPIALGIGFLVPAMYAVPICLGALATWAMGRRWKLEGAAAAAAGGIAGEAVVAVAVAALIATGLLAPH